MFLERSLFRVSPPTPRSFLIIRDWETDFVVCSFPRRKSSDNDVSWVRAVYALIAGGILRTKRSRSLPLATNKRRDVSLQTFGHIDKRKIGRAILFLAANGFSKRLQKWCRSSPFSPRFSSRSYCRTAIYLPGLPAGLTDVYRISTVCSPPRDNTDPRTNCCSGRLSPVNDVSERRRVIGENPLKSLTNREPKSEFTAED